MDRRQLLTTSGAAVTALSAASGAEAAAPAPRNRSVRGVLAATRRQLKSSQSGFGRRLAPIRAAAIDGPEFFYPDFDTAVDEHASQVRVALLFGLSQSLQVLGIRQDTPGVVATVLLGSANNDLSRVLAALRELAAGAALQTSESLRALRGLKFFGSDVHTAIVLNLQPERDLQDLLLPGGEEQRVRIDYLSVASQRCRFTGRAPAGANVTLTLATGTADPQLLSVTADENGLFRLTTTLEGETCLFRTCTATAPGIPTQDTMGFVTCP